MITLEDFKLYVCPSFSLLGRVPRKLKLEEVSDALIIAPCLPTAHWYPQLPELLVQRPALLPQCETPTLASGRRSTSSQGNDTTNCVACTEIARRSEDFSEGSQLCAQAVVTRNSTLQYGRSFCCSCEKKQRNPLQTDLVTICDFFTAQFENSNKTLWERIFGRGCNMRMILLTCLIAAKQLSSYPTRENKSFTLLLC